MSFLKACEDGTAELAPPPSLREVSEEPVVEIDRKGASASATRGRPEKNVRGAVFEVQRKPNIYHQSVSATGATQVVTGDVYNHFDSNPSLFDSLTLRGGCFADQQSAQIAKIRYRAARAVSRFGDSSFSFG
jgi:hypothetical protein